MSMKFNYLGACLAISTRTVSLIFYLEDKVKNLKLLFLGWHFLPFVPRPREFPSTYGSRLQSQRPSPAGLCLNLPPWPLCAERRRLKRTEPKRAGAAAQGRDVPAGPWRGDWASCSACAAATLGQRGSGPCPCRLWKALAQP